MDAAKMNSKDNHEVDVATDMFCAPCGIAEVDEINLKKCDDCDLVRYCCDECFRQNQLRDEILFRQPESSHLGDCPICCLPLSYHPQASTLMGCCSKIVCKGCEYANKLRVREARLQHTCPFCRHPTPTTLEEGIMNVMKRVAAKDSIALRVIGMNHYDEGDHESALEYYTKAAELGDIGAHYLLSVLYREGEGVEKDMGKVLYHMEEAAIGGHPTARYYLGCIEDESSRFDRAVKHWIIGANLGCDNSIQALKQYYATYGAVNKEDFATALRAHHAAANAAKSPQREAASKFMRNE